MAFFSLNTEESTIKTPERERIHAIDELRGLVLISMLLFHLVYDIAYLTPIDVPWFAPPLQNIWQYSIAWTFIFIAGMSSHFTRSNLKRFLLLFSVAVLVSFGTWIGSVDLWVRFGIIHCIATCVLIYLIAQPILERIPLRISIVVLLLLFIIFFNLPLRKVGIPGFYIPVSESFYQGGFAWLGLPPKGYLSGDYYPVIPYIFLFLTGAQSALYLSRIGFPEWMQRKRLPFLALIGKHTLVIYLIHQPLFIGILMLLGIL